MIDLLSLLVGRGLLSLCLRPQHMSSAYDLSVIDLFPVNTPQQHIFKVYFSKGIYFKMYFLNIIFNVYFSTANMCFRDTVSSLLRNVDRNSIVVNTSLSPD